MSSVFAGPAIARMRSSTGGRGKCTVDRAVIALVEPMRHRARGNTRLLQYTIPHPSCMDYGTHGDHRLDRIKSRMPKAIHIVHREQGKAPLIIFIKIRVFNIALQFAICLIQREVIVNNIVIDEFTICTREKSLFHEAEEFASLQSLQMQ